MSTFNLTRDDIIVSLGEQKNLLAQRYGVIQMALFGSYARNEARPDSDIDVVVELAEPDLFALVHIKDELEACLHKPIDLIPYTANINGFLKARIQRDAMYV